MKKTFPFLYLIFSGYLFGLPGNTLEIRSLCEQPLRVEAVYYVSEESQSDGRLLVEEAAIRRMSGTEVDREKTKSKKLPIGTRFALLHEPGEMCVLSQINEVIFVQLKLGEFTEKIVFPLQGHRILVVKFVNDAFVCAMADADDPRKKFIVGFYYGNESDTTLLLEEALVEGTGENSLGDFKCDRRVASQKSLFDLGPNIEDSVSETYKTKVFSPTTPRINSVETNKTCISCWPF